MARNKNGYAGGLNGTMGNLVAYRTNGMSFVRRRPEFKKNQALSEKQILHRAKFKLASTFYRSLKELLASTYETEPGVTVRNVFMGNMLARAIGGDITNLYIDYNEVLVSSGSLKKVMFPLVESTQPGSLHFSWQSIDVTGTTIHDKAIMVAYCEELEAVWYTLNGPERSSLEGQLDVPFFSGKQVHVWMAFISPDGLNTSRSEYAGQVQVL